MGAYIRGGLITAGAYIRGGRINGGAYILGELITEMKKGFEKSFTSADQNTFCTYWYLINKLQNVIINRIHFDTS